MKLLLEKLSRYWQLRFLALSAGVVLVVYAVVMPVHSNESVDSNAGTVLPSDESANASSVQPVADKHAATPSASAFSTPWLGENHAVADVLKLAAQADEEEDLPRNFSESIRALRSGAEHDNPVAQFLLGHAYQVGLGVPKDMSETVRWYKRAAETRNPASTDTVKQLSPKDFAEAFEAYRKSAEEGDSNAELYFGLAYDLGRDLPKDSAEAARWYRKAAAHGSFSAASNLGVIYYNGDGVPRDSMEAAAWFEKAAARGSASAQYSLGRIYYQGKGVAKNDALAAVWLEKAASQGNARAEVQLSVLYATGQGVPGNTARAYMWINLASATENQARISRNAIEKEIPPIEIAEGQKLTHDWISQHSRSLR